MLRDPRARAYATAITAVAALAGAAWLWRRRRRRSSPDATTAHPLIQTLRRACPRGAVTLEDRGSLERFLSAARGSANPVASSLVLIIDFDLTMSAPLGAECHHMLRDSPAMPEAFRQDVWTLFDARDEAHPEHDAIFGAPDAPDRPHRFWMHYNKLLAKHRITRSMVDRAVAGEKKVSGDLLRPGVGELLALCDEVGALVVILSAGIEQVIRSSFAHDGVALPAGCHILTNTLVFDDHDCCVAVEPTAPPASREGKLKLLNDLEPLRERRLVLLIGDKPVDARVGRGMPPFRGGGGGGGGGGGSEGADGSRIELAFGFFNERPTESGALPPDVNKWRSAFNVLAHRGNEATFAPVAALVRAVVEPDT